MYFPDTLTRHEERCVVDCVLRRKMAFLTGYFANNKCAVQRIAKDTRAVLDGPMAQTWMLPQSRPMFMPSYTLLFGQFRACACPPMELSPNWAEFQEQKCGIHRPPEDLTMLMLSLTKLPKWHFLATGSAFVPRLGKITQKQVDWGRWFPHVHQLPIWYATSIPSKASRERQEGRAKGSCKPAPTSPQSRPKGAMGEGKGRTKAKTKTMAKCARPSRPSMSSTPPPEVVGGISADAQ